MTDIAAASADPSRRRRRPPHRFALLFSVCTLALSTCASGLSADTRLAQTVDRDPEVTTRSATFQTAEAPTTSSLRPPPLPDPDLGLMRPRELHAEASTDSEQVGVDFEPVTTMRPRVRLEGDPDVDDIVSEAMRTEGVTFATTVFVDVLAVRGEKGRASLTVAIVDPPAFRRLTPQVTADAVDVWRRIIEGDAAFTHDVGHRLGLELGSRAIVGSGEDTVRVGAYASNGVPPVADAVVSRATARELGLTGKLNLYVTVDEGVDHEQMAATLAETLGMDAEVLGDPPTRRAFLSGSAARNAFDPFSYVSIGDGMIQIDPDWVRRNIVSARVPIFTGNVICHRLLIPQLRGALEEVVDQGLDHLIDPTQYGGCWVPRHILFNPNRGLSMHSWGLAVDFNVKGNEYGNRNPEMDPRIVEIFQRWGFAWGGHWSTPDGMHFELSALLHSQPN